MNITITGDIGSGKSTVGKLLAEHFNYTMVDAGQLYRQFSTDVLEQNKSGDWSIDRKIDRHIKHLGETEDNQVFVSRLAWYFVPNSIKIYLMVNPLRAAQRIFDAKREKEIYADVNEVMLYNAERNFQEMFRYRRLYNMENPTGLDDATIVLAIGNQTVDTVVKCLIHAIESLEYGWYVDPACLLPTQGIRDFSMDKIDWYKSLIKSDYAKFNVDLELFGNNLYIKDGHHRVCASLFKRCPFVNVPKPNCVANRPDVPSIYDYEDAFNVDLSLEKSIHDLHLKSTTMFYWEGKLTLNKTTIIPMSLEDICDFVYLFQKAYNSKDYKVTHVLSTCKVDCKFLVCTANCFQLSFTMDGKTFDITVAVDIDEYLM